MRKYFEIETKSKQTDFAVCFSNIDSIFHYYCQRTHHLGKGAAEKIVAERDEEDQSDALSSKQVEI